jgi:hypothetical protein
VRKHCDAFLTAHCSKLNGGFSWVVIPRGPIGADILLPAYLINLSSTLGDESL